MDAFVTKKHRLHISPSEFLKMVAAYYPDSPMPVHHFRVNGQFYYAEPGAGGGSINLEWETDARYENAKGERTEG